MYDWNWSRLSDVVGRYTHVKSCGANSERKALDFEHVDMVLGRTAPREDDGQVVSGF